jgi:VanZ family protein
VVQDTHRVLVVVAFLLLTAVTVTLGVAYSRYRSVGPELLVNGDFSRGLDDWRLSGPPGAIAVEPPRTVRLQAADMEHYVGLTQAIHDARRFALLELSGTIRTEAVVAGMEAWHKARLILSSFDQEGQWIPAAHLVAGLEGNHPWQQYATVFPVIPEAEELQVSIQLARATGRVWVRDLSLREAVEKPLYVFLQAGAFGLWGVFLAWLMVPLVVTCPRNLLRGALIVCMLLVLSGTLLPGSYRRVVERDMTDAYQSATSPGASVAETQPPDRPRSIEVWDRIRNAGKSGHFVLYGLLGISLAVAFPARAWRTLMLELGMMGGATELLQFFIEGRTPLVGDWLLDLAGAGAGLGLVTLWRRTITREE